ncbi:hypothetical protein DRZ78_02920 [Candidatus Aerophobetes bacterium]|uniref:Uncharacterized protein n=1 Tax=Aerophobetes bacterium TaxID=2030807 RepID=A0A662CZP9_UNCAE|nr:MAG: hypothetical protein DRZ78_02920 [Candidatus Aerophobetes bacterium]
MQKITDEKLIAALERITHKYLEETVSRKDFEVEIVAIRVFARVIKDNHTFPVRIEFEVNDIH